ncbi:hypothetical protein OYE22_01725 [Streptomyces sp. 71268]|uniref:hypothetical protein n=1 Tax=Streptomyces sp. 71268 TaxID=3002640 RepID=UPI0023F9038E|nr:hypothetical protein [Streptomyces sp. 71268]WEV24054.1 hypothetical protein OYE22_01725 [Streptomyces sp. 71268]
MTAGLAAGAFNVDPDRLAERGGFPPTMRIRNSGRTTHQNGSIGAAYTPVTDNLMGLGTATPSAGGCNAENRDATKIYSPPSQPIERTTAKYNGKARKAKWEAKDSAPGTGADAERSGRGRALPPQLSAVSASAGSGAGSSKSRGVWVR